MPRWVGLARVTSMSGRASRPRRVGPRGVEKKVVFIANCANRNPRAPIEDHRSPYRSVSLSLCIVFPALPQRDTPTEVGFLNLALYRGGSFAPFRFRLFSSPVASFACPQRCFSSHLLFIYRTFARSIGACRVLRSVAKNKSSM